MNVFCDSYLKYIYLSIWDEGNQDGGSKREGKTHWVFSPPGSVSINCSDEFDMMFLQISQVLNM